MVDTKYKPKIKHFEHWIIVKWKRCLNSKIRTIAFDAPFWCLAICKMKKKKGLQKSLNWCASTLTANWKEEQPKTFNLTMSPAHFEPIGRCTNNSRQWQTVSSYSAALHSTTEKKKNIKEFSPEQKSDLLVVTQHFFFYSCEYPTIIYFTFHFSWTNVSIFGVANLNPKYLLKAINLSKRSHTHTHTYTEPEQFFNVFSTSFQFVLSVSSSQFSSRVSYCFDSDAFFLHFSSRYHRYYFLVNLMSVLAWIKAYYAYFMRHRRADTHNSIPKFTKLPEKKKRDNSRFGL